MSEFNISVLNLMALLIGFFVFKYLTESLYAKLIVRPNGRPPKDSWGLNAYSKEACKSHKKNDNVIYLLDVHINIFDLNMVSYIE